MICVIFVGDNNVIPHIESSESEDSSGAPDENPSSDSDSSDSEQNDQVPLADNSSEATLVLSPNRTKTWTPKCDDKLKPQLNMHFPTLEDAYLYYKEYGRQCGFDVRKSTKKTDRLGNILAKYMLCSRGGDPYANKLRDRSGNYIEGPSRRTSSQRCNCRARITLKQAAVRGFVIMGFEEEHNHPLATGRSKMFLRCNRNVSVAYQDFIVDCGRANIGPTRAHSLVKEMTGSYEDVGATIADFKNFSRDVKVRIGDHDTDQLLSKFKTRMASPDDAFYYDYKLDNKGRLSGLFWTDAIGRANYDVYGDIISFDPTFRTNRYTSCSCH